MDIQHDTVDVQHDTVHDVQGCGYSGVCTCVATEFAALEPLHGAIHVRQGFAAPAPTHAAAHVETPLLD